VYGKIFKELRQETLEGELLCVRESTVPVNSLFVYYIISAFYDLARLCTTWQLCMAITSEKAADSGRYEHLFHWRALSSLCVFRCMKDSRWVGGYRQHFSSDLGSHLGLKHFCGHTLNWSFHSAWWKILVAAVDRCHEWWLAPLLLALNNRRTNPDGKRLTAVPVSL
jgi:hypothetical protein